MTLGYYTGRDIGLFGLHGLQTPTLRFQDRLWRVSLGLGDRLLGLNAYTLFRLSMLLLDQVWPRAFTFGFQPFKLVKNRLCISGFLLPVGDYDSSALGETIKRRSSLSPRNSTLYYRLIHHSATRTDIPQTSTSHDTKLSYLFPAPGSVVNFLQPATIQIYSRIQQTITL